MASSVIQNPTDISTDRQCILIGISLEANRFATIPMPVTPLPWGAESELAKNRFATVPMLALRKVPAPQLALEEEWHIAFEQAISERAARVSQQLRNLATTDLLPAMPVTDPLATARLSILTRAHHYWRERKFAIILFCLGLALFLLGFDLMGLLVLAR